MSIHIVFVELTKKQGWIDSRVPRDMPVVVNAYGQTRKFRRSRIPSVLFYQAGHGFRNYAAFVARK